MKTRIFINGFGRIGRAVSRILYHRTKSGISLAGINETAMTADNLVYLHNYCSTYGPARVRAARAPGGIRLGSERVPVFSCRRLCELPWKKMNIDILVEATGSLENLKACRKLVQQRLIRKVIVTHSPDSGVDATLIPGVNEKSYQRSRHDVVSASICDANAVAHVLAALHHTFGIEKGAVTTLHPWLSYQNLLDGPVRNLSQPAGFLQNFSLGRASLSNLILKQTSAVEAVNKVIPALRGRLLGISYRVPTSIVTTADLNLFLRQPVTEKKLKHFLKSLTSRNPYVGWSEEPLVSGDFQGREESVVVDGRWIQVLGDRLAKINVWYDNEWGYAARVLDLVKIL